MLNQTRQLYKRIQDLNKRQLSPAEVAHSIQMADELKSMSIHAGWKHVEHFMGQAKAGTHATMEREIAVIKGFTIFSLFSAFAKYLLLSAENRAYNKIKTYVDVSIQNGERLAADRAKRETGK